MMDNSKIFAVILIIAVIAVIGRIIINRQQKGGIDWGKIALIAIATAAFLSAFFAVDSYRLDKWIAGKAEYNDCNSGRSIGRQSGSSVPRIDDFNTRIVPYLFTSDVIAVEPTGYWKRRVSPHYSSPVERQELVSRDGKRSAIKHSIKDFDITRNPSDPSLYVGIYKITLESSQKILAVMDPKDAHTGLLPVSTTTPLSGKMADIAAQDPAVLKTVLVESFDFVTYNMKPASYILYKVIAGILAAAIVLAIAFPIYKKIRSRN